ncbi:MAG: TetR/AcrR family transcriptional regulator, partial [Pseudomonadota bacterium]
FGARTQAIADAAGVNKALVHYYYRTKEKLYSQVLRRSAKRLLNRVSEAWQSEAPVTARLEKVIDAYLDNISQYPNIPKIMLREIIDGGDRLRKSFGETESDPPEEFGFTPGFLIKGFGRDLGLSQTEAVHFLVSLMGMCVASFMSPVMLETVVKYSVPDFDSFLNERRASIKAVALAYVGSRLAKPVRSKA